MLSDFKVIEHIYFNRHCNLAASEANTGILYSKWGNWMAYPQEYNNHMHWRHRERQVWGLRNLSGPTIPFGCGSSTAEWLGIGTLYLPPCVLGQGLYLCISFLWLPYKLYKLSGVRHCILAVQEAGSLKLSCWQVCFGVSWRLWGRICFMLLFYLLLWPAVLGAPWLVDASLLSLPLSSRDLSFISLCVLFL